MPTRSLFSILFLPLAEGFDRVVTSTSLDGSVVLDSEVDVCRHDPEVVAFVEDAVELV